MIAFILNATSTLGTGIFDALLIVATIVVYIMITGPTLGEMTDIKILSQRQFHGGLWLTGIAAFAWSAYAVYQAGFFGGLASVVGIGVMLSIVSAIVYIYCNNRRPASICP